MATLAILFLLPESRFKVGISTPINPEKTRLMSGLKIYFSPMKMPLG
jgi:hypothetical protein